MEEPELCYQRLTLRALNFSGKISVEAGLDFSQVVSSNVYVDNIDEFADMNKVYGLYFKNAPPTRTTVQPHAPVERKRDAEGRAPKLEEVSVIAVR